MLEELSIEELLALEGEETEGEEGHEEAEEVPNPVLPTGSDIIWAAVFFFALWALMKYVLLPPILRTRAERAEKISSAKDAVVGASGDVAEKQAAYDEAVSTAREEAVEIMEAARRRADANRAKVMAAANAEVAEARAAAETELASAKEMAISSLHDDVSSVAVGAASSVIGRPVDASSAQSAIDRVLSGGAS